MLQNSLNEDLRDTTADGLRNLFVGSRTSERDAVSDIVLQNDLERSRGAMLGDDQQI